MSTLCVSLMVPAHGPDDTLLCVHRAECDGLRSILSSPLSWYTTLELQGDTNCPILTHSTLEEFFVEGGTLTLTGPSTTEQVDTLK